MGNILVLRKLVQQCAEIASETDDADFIAALGRISRALESSLRRLEQAAKDKDGSGQA